MKQRIMPRKAAHILVALLTVFNLSLIVRASLVVWQAYGVGASNAFKLGPNPSSLGDLVPLIVGLGFITIGLAVWLASQRRLSPIFFLLVSATLSAGLPTGWPSGDDISARLFYFLLAWLAPFAFQFYLGLADRPLRPVEKAILGVLYALAILWSLPLLLSWSEPAVEQDWFAVLRVTIRVDLVMSFVLAWMRLWREYRGRASLLIRGHIRLVLFGPFFGFAPLVFLSLLPDTLQLAFHLPYVATFPWLLLAPLAYAYALYRSRLARAELALNRAAVYYLLVLSLLTLYLLTAALMNSLAVDLLQDSVLRNAVLTVALVLLFAPLKRGVERLINWVLYGGEVNYVGMVQRLAEALSLTLDRETLRRLLLEEWAPAMRLSRCLLLLRDQRDTLLFLGSAGGGDFDHLQLPVEGTLATYLEAIDEPVPDDQVHQAMQDRSLNAGEQALLALDNIAYWLPLVSGRTLQGLLVIGLKEGVDFFTPEDEHILATVAYQAGVAAHNVRLMEELRTSQQELAQAHQQLLIGREQERQRLAHELHDGAVQRLLGISYQMKDPSSAADGALPALRREVLGVVAQLRSVISELRPAGLAELGLAAALEGYIAGLRREGDLGALEVQLDLDQEEQPLPEPVAICLFRSAQEGLRNTLRHARARRFEIYLRSTSERVDMEWCDDGCGFRIPSRLSELASAGHYGLVSMSERVAAVGGQLTVHSDLNTGTQVLIRVPLKSTDGENG